ncbi:MAG: carboxyl-terminal processing protease, partial [Myxococcota bacterium]
MRDSSPLFLAVCLLLATGCNKQATAPAESTTPTPAKADPAAPDKPAQAARTEADELKALTDKMGDLGPDELAQLHDQLTARVVKQMIEERHLQQRPMDDTISRKAFDLFVDRLDPVKMYLLAEHIETLKADRDLLDDQVATGQLVVAHAAGKMLTDRVIVVGALVAKLLTQPFDLTDDESMETDEEKRGYCATEPELADRWRQALELQALYRIERRREMERDEAEEATKTKKEPAAPLSDEQLEREVREKMAQSYSSRFERLQQRDRMDRTERMLNALASVYDPHSAYMPPRRKEDFDIRMSGTLEGIGAVLVEDEHLIKVVRIVPGSASWRQGELKPEDYLLAVAEEKGEPVDLVDMRLRDAVRLIRGKKGTVVKLTVKKPDGERVV